MLAIFAGAGLAALSYAMLTRTSPQSISPFFLDRALPEGGGTNVINVMLKPYLRRASAGKATGGGVRQMPSALTAANSGVVRLEVAAKLAGFVRIQTDEP